MAIYPDRKDAMSGLFSKTAQAVGRNGLSYRLLSYILVCSTVLAMIITVLQLGWDYRKDVAVIEDSIGQSKPPSCSPSPPVCGTWMKSRSRCRLKAS